MKRTFSTTTTVAALALLCVPACKGGAGEAGKLIPDDAKIVAGVDLKALADSPLYEKSRENMDDEQKAIMEALEGCKLGKATWKSLLLGVDPEDRDKRAVIATVDGIGKKENLECLHGKLNEIEGEEPWSSEEKDGKLVLTLKKDKGIGYVVNDNVLAIVGKGWSESVKGLMGGEGKPALDNSLKELVGRTDTSKAIWAAGSIPSKFAQGPAEGLKDFSGWADVSAGIEVSIAAGFGDEAKATAKAKEFNEMFTKFKGAASAMGVPQPVVDSVKIEGKGATVEGAAKASKEEIDQIADALKKAFRMGR